MADDSKDTCRARRSSPSGNKSNVLCLGMSYPSIERQREEEGVSWDNIDNKTQSVDQTVEFVRRGILTQMDGRDLARCIAMEDSHNAVAYTVSQESGAQYDPCRHLNANFNRRNFVKQVKGAWGEDIKFSQIILDYFWIPQGTWMMQHWARSFFTTTLPQLVQEGILEFETSRSQKNDTPKGVVYLPFCFHCIKQIVACIDRLSEFYTISFVDKSELKEHALWAGTSTMCPQTMQEWLGKQLNQEEIYCTFNSRDVSECIEDAYVTKYEIEKVLRKIEDFADVRMIRLQPLQIHDPNRRKVRSERHKNKPMNKVGFDVGGFVGLKPAGEVLNGYDEAGTPDDESSYASEDPPIVSAESDVSEPEEEVPRPLRAWKPRKKKMITFIDLTSPPRASTKRRPTAVGDQLQFANMEEYETFCRKKASDFKGISLLRAAFDHIAESDYDLRKRTVRTIGTDAEYTIIKTPQKEKGKKPKPKAKVSLTKHRMSKEQERLEVQSTRTAILERTIGQKQKEQLRKETKVHRKKQKKKATKLNPDGSTCYPILSTQDELPKKETSSTPELVRAGLVSEGSRTRKISNYHEGKAIVELQNVNTVSPQGTIYSTSKAPGTPTNHENCVGLPSQQIAKNMDMSTWQEGKLDGSGEMIATRKVENAGVFNNVAVHAARRDAGNASEVSFKTFLNEAKPQHAFNPANDTMDQPRYFIPVGNKSSRGRPVAHSYHSSQARVLALAAQSSQNSACQIASVAGQARPFFTDGRALWERQLPPMLGLRPERIAIHAALDSECYTGTKLCSDLIMRAEISPTMTVSELTRMLVEDSAPEHWLSRVCQRTATQTGIPQHVYVSYGHGMTTIVALNTDNEDVAEISVGLCTTRRGPVLDPLNNISRYLHPSAYHPSEVFLCTVVKPAWRANFATSRLVTLDFNGL